MNYKSIIPFLFVLAIMFFFLPYITFPFLGFFSGFELLTCPRVVSDAFGNIFPFIGSIILLSCLIIGVVSSFLQNNDKIAKYVAFVGIAGMVLSQLLSWMISRTLSEDSFMGGVPSSLSAGWYLTLFSLIGVLVLDYLSNANMNPQQTFFSPTNASPNNTNDAMGMMQQKMQSAGQNIAEQFNALKPNPSPSQFTTSLIWETSNKRINKHMAEEALSLACKEFHLDYELLDEFNQKELHSGNSLCYRKVLVFSQNQAKLSSSFSNYFQEYYYRNMFKQVLKEG